MRCGLLKITVLPAGGADSFEAWSDQLGPRILLLLLNALVVFYLAVIGGRDGA